MIKAIDHIVIVVGDLDLAAKHYGEIGFTVVAGGKHPVGSYNVLIALADGSYIELISYYRSSPDHRWWAALQRGEGLVDFCMQTDDLPGDTERLRGVGVMIADPVPWSRKRPDGYEVKWLLSLAREGHRGVAPFLIQDVTPREERIPRRFEHKNGSTGIGAVTVAVEDLAAVRNWYEALLGSAGAEIERKDLQAHGLRFEVGPHRFDFLTPNHSKSPLTGWIKARGASPYAATLRSSLSQGQTLQAALTHGARLAFE